MLPHQRQWAHAEFHRLLAQSTGAAFETLFHRLMELCHGDYVLVRTHGTIGDLGCDGLGMQDRTLYACYGPETAVVSEIRGKFHSDLTSAVIQRPEQFDTFVFVHNDRRGGVHPVVSGLLVEAQTTHPNLKFQQLGPSKLWNKAVRLDRAAMELLLDVPEIPVHEVVYGIGMAELEPLLDHLRTMRTHSSHNVSLTPLAYNALGTDYGEAIKHGLRLSPLIDQYYGRVLDAAEHDEVAAGFTAHYQQVRTEHPGDPDAVMWLMEVYVLGNQLPRAERRAAAYGVLAHFFERCDIFDRPPDRWEPGQPNGWSA